MAATGLALLIGAFGTSIGSVICLAIGSCAGRRMASLVGRILAMLSAILLLACCGVLTLGFITGDVSILYVLQNRSTSNDGLAWLYTLSGLWAGRAGSLMFWTFLIALFGTLIVLRSRLLTKGAETSEGRSLDDIALAVIFAVVAIFCGILLFSEGNMPFEATPERFFAEDGRLAAAASSYSMNQLLEHWAMAIHPPLLFVGYAGLTVPFGYAIAALIRNDSSTCWVELASRFVLASWLFLTAGIGLGAVWAYVVLGWGGYWGWDPVENASLLSWLICVALMHTFTAYRQRGAFKRWAVMCACFAFTFVIIATFITRSGIVESVHAFAGDPISLALFGSLILLSLIIPIIGLAIRWKSFGPDDADDDIENMLSKDAAYYFNNVVMVLFAILLTYMTLSSALPSWFPFGGTSLGTASYEAIARPLGILYLLILAVCPLLAWGKTNLHAFLRQARIPAIFALILFLLLMAYWAFDLLPVYDESIARDDATSLALLEAGPAWYYNGLAIMGLLVACLLLFNAAFMLIRNIRAPRKRGAAIGGSISHVSMAIILIGLIGSNMYVTETSGYMGFNIDANQATETFTVKEYELAYAGNSVIDDSGDSGNVIYQVDFDVFKDGQLIGQVHPSVQLDTSTQQQKLNAAVLRFPDEDLFVVYRGTNQEGAFSLDVRVNPLISLVWVGFALLMIGMFCALIMPRRAQRIAASDKTSAADCLVGDSAEPSSAEDEAFEHLGTHGDECD